MDSPGAPIGNPSPPQLRPWALAVCVLIGAGTAWALKVGGGAPREKSGVPNAPAFHNMPGELIEPARQSPPARPPATEPPAAEPAPPPREAEPQPQPAPPVADETAREKEPPPVEAPAPRPDDRPLPPGAPLRFREIWAYLMPGEESLWPDAAPITDLALFDFSLDPVGRLKGKANTQAIQRAQSKGIRTHLVIASSGNTSLLHLVVTPRYGVRNELIAEIAALPDRHRVDGVQLDLEGPRSEDREDLLGFIRELHGRLPARVILSIALPAKTSDASGAYLYREVGDLAERLFIMTYDQHWRGGPPGAISALDWHDRVLACARANLPADRVVVGLPFYGRVWQREEVAKAVKYAKAEELASRTAAAVQRDSARTHTFTYKTEVTAECWFEDAASLRAKLDSAQSHGFRNVGFWRLGQEDTRIWGLLARE